MLIAVILPLIAGGATLESEKLYGASKVRGSCLSRGVSARPVSMGEAFTAVADDASAVSWNPAGLGRVSSLSAVATYDAVGQDVGITYLATAWPASRVTPGLAVTVVNLGSYDARDRDGVKTGSVNLMSVVLAGAFAFSNPEILGKGWTGLGAEVVSEPVGGSVFGFTAGGVHQLVERVDLGWAVQHVGTDGEGFSLPAVAKLGLGLVAEDGVRVSTDLGYRFISGEPMASVGGEMSPVSNITLRAGYRYSRDGRVNGSNGFAAGLGFRYSSLDLDYAYQPFGELATSHRFALVYRGEKAK